MEKLNSDRPHIFKCSGQYLFIAYIGFACCVKAYRARTRGAGLHAIKYHEPQLELGMLSLN